MADARIGDEGFHVLLDEGHQASVDDPDDGQDGQARGEGRRGLRKEGEPQPQEAVGAHLQEHGGQQHRARRRRLDVGVGQPGVEREERDLDGESQAEGQEEPGLEGGGEGHGGQVGDRQRVGAGRSVIRGVEDQDADQHEQAAEHGEQDELHGGVDPAAAAPDADEEVHGDEHGLPEHVEEEQVEGDEDPDHAGLEQEHEEREFPDPVGRRRARRTGGPAGSGKSPGARGRG